MRRRTQEIVAGVVGLVVLFLAVLLLSASGQERLRRRPLYPTSFQPTDVANCVLWLKADGITGLSDNDAVVTWDDLSGNDNDVTQSTSGNRPTWQTNELNSLPVVRFDGTDDRLTRASGDADFNTGSVSIVVVYKPTPGSFPGEMDVVGNYNNNVLFTLISGQVRFYNANASVNVAESGSLSLNTWYLSTAILNGGTSLRLRRANAQTALLSDGGSGASGEGLAIGAYSAAATVQFFQGDIAEVLWYSRALTDGEADQVEDYLSAKYGSGILN